MADGGWQQAGQRSGKVEGGTVGSKQRFGGNTIRFLGECRVAKTLGGYKYTPCCLPLGYV